ncbi:MAG: RasGEF domain-containing protein [Gammaproteobacteria bacterium]|nr:RasGEF domain-containing protein [Gammaproteobacteria bacterium]
MTLSYRNENNSKIDSMPMLWNVSKYIQTQSNIINDISEKLYQESKHVFQSIQPDELLKKKPHTPSVDANVQRFNSLATMVVEDIITRPGGSERAFITERWIMLMAKALEKKDVATAYAIMAGLNDNKIYKLSSYENKTARDGLWASLSPNAHKTWDQATTFLKNAKDRMAQEGVIPYLGDFTGPLAGLKEKKSLINDDNANRREIEAKYDAQMATYKDKLAHLQNQLPPLKISNANPLISTPKLSEAELEARSKELIAKHKEEHRTKTGITLIACQKQLWKQGPDLTNLQRSEAGANPSNNNQQGATPASKSSQQLMMKAMSANDSSMQLTTIPNAFTAPPIKAMPDFSVGLHYTYKPAVETNNKADESKDHSVSLRAK